MGDLTTIVGEVSRPEVREWIYGVLLGIAAVDGIADGESETLGWLMDAWSLAG
ncbi:MAG: hypothetical protein JRH11_27295 [Deltaproteobacteria bacterium]|nr:hypothetical protein [Deltaproteobacteria bacterium]